MLQPIKHRVSYCITNLSLTDDHIHIFQWQLSIHRKLVLYLVIRKCNTVPVRIRVQIET